MTFRPAPTSSSTVGAPWRIEDEPQLVVRFGGRNVFLHLLSAEIEDQRALEELVADEAGRYDAFGLARGAAVERVGIGLQPQGEGSKVLYAGFDDLAAK